MYNVLDIAKWFLATNNANKKLTCVDEDDLDVYEGITNLKLQKLLYYAQGIHLALNNGEPLFKEKILAWPHGPVVVEAYENYKKFKKDNLVLEMDKGTINAVNLIEQDTNAFETLKLAYDNFAIFTAWQLRNMTHEEDSPWSRTVKESGLNKTIELSLIQSYFLENIVSES